MKPYEESLVKPMVRQLQSNYIISLVRSQLNFTYVYCAPVWRPHLLKNNSKIEQRQRIGQPHT